MKIHSMKGVFVTGFLFILFSSDSMAGKGESESDIGFLTSMPPGSPVLQSPFNEDQIPADSVKLLWQSAYHVSEYIVQVSEEELFSSFIVHDTVTENSYKLSSLTDSLTLFWRVAGANKAGKGAHSEVWSFTTDFNYLPDDILDLVSEPTVLLSVFPNPVLQTASISFQLVEPAEISIRIYNSAGQTVCELASGFKFEGSYTLEWKGSNNQGAPVPDGAYYCVLTTGKNCIARKMVICRK